MDFHTESSEKTKCMVQGLASWLAQPNLLIKVLNQSGNTIFQKLAKVDYFLAFLMKKSTHKSLAMLNETFSVIFTLNKLNIRSSLFIRYFHA